MVYTDTMPRHGKGQSAHEKSERNEFLSKPEHELLFNMFTPKSWSLCTTVAQVLEGENGRWKLRDSGILCFIKDHVQKSFFLRLYDLDNKRITWQMELYLEIAIERPTHKLMTFDGDNCRIGLNFHNEGDCSRMQSIINDKVCRRNQSGPSIRRQNDTEPVPNPSAGAMTKMDRLAQNAKGFGNKLMDLGDLSLLSQKTKDIPGNQIKKDHSYQRKTAGNKRGNRGLQKSDIGLPSNFKVVSGYNQMVKAQQGERQKKQQLPPGVNDTEDLHKWMLDLLKNPAYADLLSQCNIDETNISKGNNATVVYRFVQDKKDRISADFNRKSMARPGHAPPPIPSGPPSRALPPPGKGRNKIAPPVPDYGRGLPPIPQNLPPSPSQGIYGSGNVPPQKPKVPAPVTGPGGPPPPPPPPPGGPAAPPPPPAPMLPPPKPSSSNNNAPKPPTKTPQPASVDPQSQLMAAIRNRGGASGGGLKKVDQSELKKNDSISDDTGSNDMAAQLRRQLEDARKFMESSDEEEEDDDSEWDDSD